MIQTIAWRDTKSKRHISFGGESFINLYFVDKSLVDVDECLNVQLFQIKKGYLLVDLRQMSDDLRQSFLTTNRVLFIHENSLLKSQTLKIYHFDSQPILQQEFKDPNSAKLVFESES